MSKSSQDYVVLLNEMRAHHKNRAQGTAAGSVTPSTPALQALYVNRVSTKGASNDPQIRALQQSAEKAGDDQAGDSKTGISNATTSFEKSGDKDTAGYTNELNKLRDRDKQNANQRIDKMYDEAIEIVEKDPSKGDAVVGTMDMVGQFFNSLLNEISNFFMDVARNILNYLKQIWEKIANTFNSVVNWISHWF
ncbi:hypothetical protein [Pseudomonas sp. 28 E 9]|jgi:uncharacterized FlaG/YvyC family protein|uniref:hypothetical protein n=1 Tax=Pseudomonas sp. 28 E 9 TaxID=1844098 RepID=UPI000811F74F|nr:hypothetical protein [Pseudomonas sp. 28 E 9]CRM14008.1 hypothetical protein [Pseudomonas sp. 28 E 9]